MAILRKKEEIEGYNIDNEVIKYIATNIKSNIRELEGALTKNCCSLKAQQKGDQHRTSRGSLKRYHRSRRNQGSHPRAGNPGGSRPL